MATRETTTLRRILIDDRFQCIPNGEYHVQDICEMVRKQHPDLCKDSDLCPENHKNGSNYPEWKHAVRAALKYLKERGQRVSNGRSHGLWSFGPE